MKKSFGGPKVGWISKETSKTEQPRNNPSVQTKLELKQQLDKLDRGKLRKVLKPLNS